ncbi:hypothetical protein BD779DRAFT_614331 [Infundibulicybe gibba]|nr:hypothetical protein BD779DRAFT_614331 [Infundibulicybe gibba]
MQFSAPFLATLSALQLGIFLASAASASPQARDTLTMFRDNNLGGPSYTSTNPAAYPCVAVPPELGNDVSSLIVGANIGCTMFFNTECVPQAGPAGPTFNGRGSGGPGVFNSLGEFNDRAAAFSCSRL